MAFDARWWNDREWSGFVRVGGSSILKIAWFGVVLVFVWGALLLDVVVSSGRYVCRCYVYRSPCCYLLVFSRRCTTASAFFAMLLSSREAGPMNSNNLGFPKVFAVAYARDMTYQLHTSL
eukprot:scaffold9268_cov52-Attheya_sp.AAC.1